MSHFATVLLLPSPCAVVVTAGMCRVLCGSPNMRTGRFFKDLCSQSVSCMVVTVDDEGGAAIVVTLYSIVINVGVWCFIAIIRRERIIYINVSKSGFKISYLLFMLLLF